MKRSRCKFSAEFKTRVVLEAIKEHKSLSELAEQFELHPNLISIWKREFLENAASVFSKGNEDKKSIQDAEKEKEELFKQIGQLKVENDWLKKSTMIPMDKRKNLIEKESPELSLCKQCELLNISRSSLYYTPSVASSLELEIMRNIDFLYTEDPTRGTRRMYRSL